MSSDPEVFAGFYIYGSSGGQDPDQRNYIVSNAKIEATGFKPMYSLDHGIHELVKGYTMISEYTIQQRMRSGSLSAAFWLLCLRPTTFCFLFPEKLKVSSVVCERCARTKFTVTLDTHFREVMTACARPRPGRAGGTWITPAMIAAYVKLHELGHAHSVGVWNEKTLVSGVYGIALGSVFFGESMFASETDASKVAFDAWCASSRAGAIRSRIMLAPRG